MAAPRKKSEKPQLSPLDVLNVSGPKKAKAAKAPKALKAAKAPKASPKAAPTPAVQLDYPQPGEAVAPGHYAVRVAAAPEVVVEVAVDGGPWQPCREAVGYYWFDWTPTLGDHTLVARAKNGGPRWGRSDERAVFVRENPAP